MGNVECGRLRIVVFVVQVLRREGTIVNARQTDINSNVVTPSDFFIRFQLGLLFSVQLQGLNNHPPV